MTNSSNRESGITVAGLYTGLEVLGSLVGHPELPDDVAVRLADAVTLVTDCCRDMLNRATRLEVSIDHVNAAVQVVTSLLDGDAGFSLLAHTLTEIDDAGLANPDWRVAVMAALAQLVSDALTMVVAVSRAVTDDAPESVVNEARRQLLSAIALIHHNLCS